LSSYKETRVDVAEFPLELRHDLPLPIDDMSLAHHLGIRNKTMWWLIHNNKKAYTTFELPKRGRSKNKVRHIQNPTTALKNVQRNILVRFLSPIPVLAHVGAYVPGRSCRDTAVQHVGQGIILSLDISDFFPSVRRAAIRRYLHRTVGYSHSVASLLAALMCYTHFVPQGAPTSGLIANLVAHEAFDKRILRELANLDPRWVYTRYSDDLDISHPDKKSPEEAKAVIKMVEHAVTQSGFRMNEKKTKMEPRHKRQKVLGMVVNEKVNIPRYEYMRTRALIHNCLIDGFEKQVKRAGMKSVAGLKSHLSGKLAFFKQVDAQKANKLRDKYDLACRIHEKPEDVEVRFDK